MPLHLTVVVARRRRQWKRPEAQLAELVHCAPGELVWTSGSTEANNLALRGVVEEVGSRSTVLVAPTEHKAVLDTVRSLGRLGIAVEEIPVDNRGLVDLGALKKMLQQPVALVSVMLANNETGVIQPLRSIAEIAHGAGSTRSHRRDSGRRKDPS